MRWVLDELDAQKAIGIDPWEAGLSGRDAARRGHLFAEYRLRAMKNLEQYKDRVQLIHGFSFDILRERHKVIAEEAWVMAEVRECYLRLKKSNARLQDPQRRFRGSFVSMTYRLSRSNS